MLRRYLLMTRMSTAVTDADMAREDYGAMDDDKIATHAGYQLGRTPGVCMCGLGCGQLRCAGYQGGAHARCLHVWAGRCAISLQGNSWVACEVCVLGWGQLPCRVTAGPGHVPGKR